VFRNFVRLMRKRRNLGLHGWENVVNGVDTSDDINKQLFKEYETLQPHQKRLYQFPALGLSSVGDVAIDLPDANVILQVSGQGGGRRQEAQRMGRILRKKSNGLDNNAKFYTLLSRDTKEMVTGAKRQEYLIDQGYQYKVRYIQNLLSFFFLIF
jgi:superfamily II DNA or RNA helicase